MTKSYLRPSNLYPTYGYSHAVIVEGPGKHIVLAGQVPFDMNNNVIGEDDFEAQVIAVFENLGGALAAAGATFADLIKLVYYAVDFEEPLRAPLAAIRDRYLSPENLPASVLIGVSALAVPGVRIEIEATAFVDR